MNKKILISSITFLTFISSVYAISSSFNFDNNKLNFSSNSKTSTIINSFDSSYKLTANIDEKNKDIKNKIIDLSKKTTSLLIGDINSSTETNEHFYNRRKEYYKLASYNYFPKDSTTESGYDESNANYKYVLASEFAIPQIFNKINELGIVYNTYGDIRVTLNDDLAISMVMLPNVKMKVENEDDPLSYDIKEDNLILYYHFLKIDDEYRLCYLYGEYGDNVKEYFSELESKEKKNAVAITSSYQSSISTLYNYDKLNKLSDKNINKIYNDNINNLVYLTGYYNSGVVVNANGFFITNNVVVTTWNFIEKSLKSAQVISASDYKFNTYEIEGIITANPNTDIALLKVKNNSNKSVTIGDSNTLSTEDPTIIISSKSGVSFNILKGILISNDGYLQSTIPLSSSDEGSPLFNSEGLVIGMNTSKSVNTSTSFAINSEIIKSAKDIVKDVDKDSLKIVTFDKLKEDYYINSSDESVKLDIPKKIWSEYSLIGDIENNIPLELIKSSYDEGVVSLRYKNKLTNYISSFELAKPFMNALVKEGFNEVSSSNNKYIYQNNYYQVIIMKEFDYLIVVMVKL